MKDLRDLKDLLIHDAGDRGRGRVHIRGRELLARGGRVGRRLARPGEVKSYMQGEMNNSKNRIKLKHFWQRSSPHSMTFTSNILKIV